ncbi:AbiJ-NTD4 domain-containing protein [Paraburkholderia aspalathi]|uniref:AbiJ-NTD4 domain-containing protein n=1 Tax=Paraburkholderia aspalathi TaxID=1324617 RepID=UPI0038BD265A
MLTDVFFRRYANRPMFESVGQKESALFVQAYRIVNEQIWKYYGYDQKVDDSVKTIWTVIHDRLSMEFGVKELSPKYYSYQTEWMGKPYTNSGSNEMNFVVEQWLNFKFTDDLDPDMFVKRRLSFVELAFRTREEQVAQANAEFPRRLAEAETETPDWLPRRPMTVPGNLSDSVRAINESMNGTFAANVHELNERLKQAGMPLHYHNGYLQITQDEQLQEEVEQPFWLLVKDAQWKNVSIDMAEAIDRRDTGGRDPSFYAAKALESTIKIICELKKWTAGNEKGVSDFLNHLESKVNGAFIEGWERQSMQRFYSDVRNDLGHGPGAKDMPNFTPQQIDQTIEFCMSWVKSLIKRL